MSRLTDLIAQAKANNPELGKELEREFKVLSSRRSFGLNFERHKPESVELPGRPVRKGDKVHILPPRGTISRGDDRLWKVLSITRKCKAHTAQLELVGEEKEHQSVSVDDLVVVAEFRDYIYPGLVSTGKVERGGDKPYHTVINGENFHVLEALTFTHRGKIDAIYIDPPYNTGAKDWKYNNDYVDDEDLYRHSKWLAMMERRLKVAKELLKPESSVLIVTIDEKEYLRLGMLLEQTFPEAGMQMVSSIINSGGTGRANEFSRTNEFIYILKFGKVEITPLKIEMEGKERKLDWQTYRRRDLASARGTVKGGPSQFYPIYVNENTGQIVKLGEPLPHDVPRTSAPKIAGCVAVFPIRPDGTEMNWGMVSSSFQRLLDKGYARAGKFTGEPQPYIIQYLKSGVIKDIEQGRAVVLGKNKDGSVDAVYKEAKLKMPTTQWDNKSHNAEHYGTGVFKALLGSRKFPFPKSLYAVEDTLRFFVGSRKDSIILDFFSGSGTTAHAVMRLNKQDGGNRQCISVTNNEVAAEEQKVLREKKLRPGDQNWERWGICDYVTKPRIEAAITGKTPEGKKIEGEYKFTNEFPMSEGFKENAEFFTLTYETTIAVSHNKAFTHISPLLWMRAGSRGRRIEKISDKGWDVAETYGIITDLDNSSAFCDVIAKSNDVVIAYIVTDDDRRFQSVARRLPDTVEPVRLYESYLNNFRFSFGR